MGVGMPDVDRQTVHRLPRGGVDDVDVELQRNALLMAAAMAIGEDVGSVEHRVDPVRSLGQLRRSLAADAPAVAARAGPASSTPSAGARTYAALAAPAALTA
jgi:hypothetical protein